MKLFSLVTLAIATIALHYAVLVNNQNQVLKLNAQIQDEQIADFQNDIVQLVSRKTYEDGVRDGIMRSQDSGYVAGYHAAISNSNSFSSIIANKEEE